MHEWLYKYMTQRVIYLLHIYIRMHFGAKVCSKEISIRHVRNSCRSRIIICTYMYARSACDISLYCNAMQQARFVLYHSHITYAILIVFREARRAARDETGWIAKYPNYTDQNLSSAHSRKRIFLMLARCVTVLLHLWHLIFRRTFNNVRLSRPRGESRHVRVLDEVKCRLTGLWKDLLRMIIRRIHSLVNNLSRFTKPRIVVPTSMSN